MNTDTSWTTVQNIDLLNQQFGNQYITFSQSDQNLIKVRLTFSQHAEAEIHLQGAHLTRWVDTQGRDNIFNSADAVYKTGVPIRGGNPIIFPQFGAGDICQHGFARNSVWRVTATKITTEATSITLQLKSDDVAEMYRQQWEHDFILRLTISLGQTLTTHIQVKNPNPYPLSFTLGFHTYLAVDDINTVEISPLSGLEYMDNLRDYAIFEEQREWVTISDFTDRRYQKIPQTLYINDQSSGRKIEMTTQNCADAFVWNPWREAEKKLSDLTPNSYQKFVCVEPGNMKTAVVLQSGQEFVTTQHIKRLD